MSCIFDDCKIIFLSQLIYFGQIACLATIMNRDNCPSSFSYGLLNCSYRDIEILTDINKASAQLHDGRDVLDAHGTRFHACHARRACPERVSRDNGSCDLCGIRVSRRRTSAVPHLDARFGIGVLTQIEDQIPR